MPDAVPLTHPEPESEPVATGRRPLRTGLTWIPDAMLGADAAEGLVRAAANMGVDLAFVPASRVWAAAACERLCESGIEPVLAFDGPWTRAAAVEGWSGLITASASSTTMSDRFLRDAFERSLELLVPQIAAGACGGTVVIADDLAADSGWIIDPRAARELYVPALATAVRAAVRAGSAVVFHSDGDVSSLFDAVSDAGVCGVHVADEAAFHDIARCAGAAGLAVWGGISVRSVERLGAQRMADDVGRSLGSVAVLCDDGGVTQESHLDSLALVHRIVRAHANVTE